MPDREPVLAYRRLDFILFEHNFHFNMYMYQGPSVHLEDW